MKNLKNTPVLTLIVAVLLAFTACKKDSDNSSGGGSSAYKFNGKSYEVTSANEKHLAGDIYLELTSGNGGDYLQLSFANVNAIPEGTLTYNADRNANYNPQTNFWASAIGLAGANINISGGTITVSRSGDNTRIDFNIQTANGPVTGQYNGKPVVSQ